jgi:3-hydroxyacyl-[acyl-carrier-protein] dehydratase
MQLDGIYFIDREKYVMAGYRNVREDEFWVRGHIPGRPLLPGVLMIETAAQLVGYYAMTQMPDRGFLGFSGVDNVKFRGQVKPGQRVIVVGRMIEVERRRCIGDTQAFVDGKQVFEGKITGMWL